MCIKPCPLLHAAGRCIVSCPFAEILNTNNSRAVRELESYFVVLLSPIADARFPELSLFVGFSTSISRRHGR